MTETAMCGACRRWMPWDDFEGDYACTLCSRRYPAALLKAVADNPWDYFLETIRGQIFHFQGARIRDDWIFISGIRAIYPEFPEKYNMERGLWIRYDQIAMVADAPHGS